MEVIVIDDGINEKYYDTGSLKYNLEFDKNGGIAERKNYDPFWDSHATTCAGIIKKYAPGCRLTSLKVLQGQEGSPKQLLNALDWCIQREDGPLLINMSIGSSVFQDFEEIGNRISRLLSRGAIIVAALNNNGSYTVPACLSGVIGVATESSYHEKEYRISLGGFCRADILASSQHKLTNFQGEVCETRICNSYAAPLITAVVHNIFEETKNNNLNVIMKLLSQSTVQRGEEALNFARPDFGLNFSSSGEEIAVRDHLITAHSELALDQLMSLPDLQRWKIVSYIPQSEGIKNKLNEINCIYWEPDFYEKAVRRDLTDKVVCSIPVVNLYGDAPMQQMAAKLCQYFRRENYYARIVSEKKEAFSLETDWVPAGISPDDFMGFYEKTFQCDMILYYSQAASPAADFQIGKRGDKIQCRAENLREFIDWDNQNNEQLLQKLFHIIESYFDQ